ncbi:hypothetical protein E2320_012776, partial [Naja naja]
TRCKSLRSGRRWPEPRGTTSRPCWAGSWRHGRYTKRTFSASFTRWPRRREITIGSGCALFLHLQLADRWRERQQTVQALWHWSRSLQRKVSLGPVSTQPQLPQPTLEPTSAPPPGCPALSRLQVLGAWGGFVQEQLRKKGRMARAAESYQAELLHEGICRILRYVAAMKQQRGCLQAQQQLQVKLEPGWQARLSPHDGASGFGALPSLMMAGGGGASAWGRLFTPGWSLGSGTGVPARPAPPALCLQAACQRHHLVYRCAMMWKQKALSRKPSLARLGAPTKKHVTFEVLGEGGGEPGQPISLCKAALHGSCWWAAALGMPSKQYFTPDHRYAARQVRLQPRRPDFLIPFPEKRGLPHPGKWTPWLHGPTGAAPELQPPSSFMLGAKRMSVETPPLSPPAAAPGKERPAVVSRGPLLAPEDFTRRSCPPLCGKAETKREKTEIQQLEEELQLIGQKMHYYYSQQQELKFCQRQERLLGKWLELRGGVGEPSDAQEIREKLGQNILIVLSVHITYPQGFSSRNYYAEPDNQFQNPENGQLHRNSQLKMQIASLVNTLEGERQLMQKYASRVQDIRAALKTWTMAPPPPV